MTREQLAHILRAASRIAGDSTIFVVGSQSILGSYDDAELPDEAIGSVEVDLYFAPDPGEEKTTKVDLHIGEETHFHEAFSIYAQGVAEETSDLPAGWESVECPGRVRSATAQWRSVLSHTTWRRKTGGRTGEGPRVRHGTPRRRIARRDDPSRAHRRTKCPTTPTQQDAPLARQPKGSFRVAVRPTRGSRETAYVASTGTL